MQSHFDTLAATLGPTVARDVLHDLKAAGFIIVRHDAIRLAQAHTLDDARTRADNDNEITIREVVRDMRALA